MFVVGVIVPALMMFDAAHRKYSRCLFLRSLSIDTVLSLLVGRLLRQLLAFKMEAGAVKVNACSGEVRSETEVQSTVMQFILGRF